MGCRFGRVHGPRRVHLSLGDEAARAEKEANCDGGYALGGWDPEIGCYGDGGDIVPAGDLQGDYDHLKSRPSRMWSCVGYHGREFAFTEKGVCLD